MAPNFPYVSRKPFVAQIDVLCVYCSDGRFVDCRACRRVVCDAEVTWLLANAVDAVVTEQGEPVSSGVIAASRGLRPALSDHQAVLFVRPAGSGRWLPLRGRDSSEDDRE